MCGILGYYGKHAAIFSKETSLEAIGHRGPDFSNSIFEENFFLGHTRLSILDLSKHGNQPMVSKDGNYIIIFNGEIYNHLELRKMVLSRVNFVSTSDTETLLYGLIEFGTDFLNKLNGVFAFSFYNFKTNEFIVARDQFGVKPLYYHTDKNGICFSSELKALTPFIEHKTLNKFAIKNYLNFLWSPGKDTPFHEIKKILPGQILTGNANNIKGLSLKKYYKITFDNNQIFRNSEKDVIDQLEKHLLNAIERQMLSDVPLGFFLSGGLDSSILVALAKKLHPNREFNCYTIKTTFNDGFENDLKYAKKVAKHLGVNLKIIEAKSNIIEYFDKVIYHLDEPQADPAPINVYNICKQAKKDGIKVLIGGTAGDDLFSGYRRHQALSYEKIFKFLPLFLRKSLKYFASKFTTSRAFGRRINKLFLNVHKTKSERIYGYFDWIDSKTLNNLFLDDINSDKHEYFKQLNLLLPKNIEDLNRMLFLELNTFLVDHNLNYTDKLSMATGVEVRVPFLDKELVEFSTKIPVNLKMKNKETKYILKKVAEKYLPHDVIYRPKTGFGAPVREWILNDMSSLIDTYLSRETIESRRIFNYTKIKELIEKNKAGKIDASYTIWSLLALESWMRQFYDKKH